MEYDDIYLNELLDECDFPSNPLERKQVCEKIKNFGSQAQVMFEQWIKERRIVSDAFDIEGVTPAFLKKHHGMTDIAIITCYDWLNKEPREASILLKQPVIRHKP